MRTYHLHSSLRKLRNGDEQDSKHFPPTERHNLAPRPAHTPAILDCYPQIAVRREKFLPGRFPLVLTFDSITDPTPVRSS